MSSNDPEGPDQTSDLFGTQYPVEHSENKYNWHTELEEERTRAAREAEAQAAQEEEQRSHSTRFFNHGVQTGYHGFDEDDRRFFSEEEKKSDTFLDNLNSARDEIE